MGLGALASWKGLLSEEEQLVVGGKKCQKQILPPDSLAADLSEQEGPGKSGVWQPLHKQGWQYPESTQQDRLSQELTGAVCRGFFPIRIYLCPAQQRGTAWE